MPVLTLFLTFLMIGFVSFGGGYAMIPVIELEVNNHGWMSTQEFTDVIAIAGMSPGPIATNSAIIVGYKTAGLSGAIFSAVGMGLPSLIIILIIATFFYRLNTHKLVKSAFYGLRPIITGLIVYGAITFSISNEIFDDLSWISTIFFMIFGLSLFFLIQWKMHPFFVIFISGIIGVVIF